MQTHEMVVEFPAVDSLRQHPDNANTSDMEALEQSIEVNGFYSPIIVQRSTGYILAGNHRWLVALRQNAPQIPAIFLDVDDTQAKRIMLADNRVARLGHDDEALLYELLQEIAEDDAELLGTGYTPSDLEELRLLNTEPLEFEAEPDLPLAAETAYDITPIEGHDGRCYEFTIFRTDGAHLTPGDLNKARRGLGLPMLERDEMEQYSIETWNRRF